MKLDKKYKNKDKKKLLAKKAHLTEEEFKKFGVKMK